MKLYCRLCAMPDMDRGDRLSNRLDDSAVSEYTEVEVISGSVTRGFHCPDCGGLSGYAVDESDEVVAISDLPANRKNYK